MYIIFGTENAPDDNDPQEGWADLSKYREHLYEISRNYTVEYKKNSDPAIISQLNDPQNSVLIIIGLDMNFTADEIHAIQDLISKGGKVIIADDHGYANQLSSSYGIEYKKYSIIANYDDNASIFIPLSISLAEDEYTVISYVP